MVLILHASSTTLPWIEESPLHDVFKLGKYGVQMFFVISGYIICESLFLSKYSIKISFKFLAKRFIRINPSTYLITIAYLLIELFSYLASGYHLILSDPFNYKLLATNFLFLSNIFETNFYIAPFWTLEIEFQFYLLIAIIFPVLTHNTLVIRYFTLALLIFFGFSNISILLSEYLACFLLGIVYFLFSNSLIGKNIFTFSLVIIATIFLRNSQYFELFFSFLSLYLISIKKPIKSNIFQFMGKISYSLYIVHAFLFMYFDVILNKFDMNHLHESIPTKALIIIAYCGIAILISSKFYQYFEKPLINYSKKISWN
jgi:peptidoglycan/LPS O-acetylase OafA/YrhL